MTGPGSVASLRRLAVAVTVAGLLLTLAACGSGTSADGAAPGAVSAAGGVPAPGPGPACGVLTRQIADAILGQPTTLLPGAGSGGADCQRAGTRDADDQVEYGWQKPGTPGYETPDQRASGCQGKTSRPAGFGAGAVLCQYRPGPLEADWLGWIVNGVLYIVVIHVDDQALPEDAAVHAAHLLAS